MPWFSADLHLHSCLSPCGSLESSPAAIAAAARSRGIDLVALTDHNSALNCPAFAENCRRAGLSAVFGMEATSAEEAHCLCLFESPGAALDFGELLYRRLAPIPNDPERWGDQVQVNADEEIEGEVELLLVGATDLPLDELCSLVHARGGLFIPAHVDRAAFSLMSQLGFAPAMDYDALEIYRADTNLRTVRLKPRRLAPGDPEWDDRLLPPEAGPAPDPEALLPALICDSDAHYLEDVGKRRFGFWSDEAVPGFAGLRRALRRGWVRRHFEG